MSNLIQQRDFVIALKKETILNVRILSRLQPIPSELSRLLQENNLEKPTQNLFNHLSQYLVNIIDPKVSLPWPLYDSKTERTYRNAVSMFISDYSGKGLLSPVMSSYLVNPGCYKVTVLMFQMSQLAVQRMLVKKMNKDCQKKLYNEMTEKYKSQNDESFIESVEEKTEMKWNKFTNYLSKKDAMEKIAKMLRDHIIYVEDKMSRLKVQILINNLVDGYIEKHPLDEEAKNEILEIKDVNKPAKYFEKWLLELDYQMSEMELNWNLKTKPLLNISQKAFRNTETLIARQTGQADKKTFMIEYNPKTDYINTDELEKQVNIQQKYILKNIIRDGKLNFPNLIRGFLISISFILKNAEIGDEIYQFNECLNVGKQHYSEIVNGMRILLERILNADQKLQQRQDSVISTISTQEIKEIPPLPDLSDIKMNREFHPQIQSDAFTPLNFEKHQFNLFKQRTGSFNKPVPKVFTTPIHFQVPNKDDFFKSLISCRVSAYDNMNITQNNLNISVISQATNKGNETIASCTSGFTKQQISRLLSTKKSSSKKFKHKLDRSEMKKIKKRALIYESSLNESIKSNLCRSHSSPNLYENCDKRLRSNLRSRKLSIMKEHSPSLLEVSGIAALERDSNHSTPQGMVALESSRKLIDAASLPSIILTPNSDIFSNSNAETDLNKQIEFKEPKIIQPLRKSKETYEECMILQQIKGKTLFEKYDVLPQRKSKEIEGLTALQQRKSKEMLEEQTVLLQRKSNEIFGEQFTLPQRNSKEFHENPKIQRKSNGKEDQIVFPQRKSTENLKEVPQRNSKEFHENPKIQRKSNGKEDQIAFPQRKSTENLKENTKSVTPKNNPHRIEKTNSLEKIINRFKKLRASILPTEAKEESNDIKTIFEEKENLSNANFDGFIANRNLLPDLLSPSCSIIAPKGTDFSEQIYFDCDEEPNPKTRVSLGAALGVDATFLDQFDLID